MTRPISMNNARRIAAFFAVAAASACVLSGCAAATEQHRAGKPVVLTARQVTTLREYGQADTAFGFSLLREVCAAKTGGNIALSPVSVSSALGLAYLGARGETASAIANVLRLPAASGPALTTGLRDRLDLLASLARPGVEFSQSNRIWADKSLPPRPSYVAALRSAYRAGLGQVPLVSDPDAAARVINSAIDRDTHGHIPELLAPDSLHGIGWLLTNALYLKAAWAQPFSHVSTAPGSFDTGTGQVRANYLNGRGFKTAGVDGWAAASLPYKGHRLAMYALLPPAGQGPDSGSCRLPDPTEFVSLSSELAHSHHEMSIAMPKVKLSWSGSLMPELSQLGMGLAFSPAANFTGISPKACCIGLVQHAATLDVAEKGTVASAATAVGVTPTSLPAPQPTLRFDRPYLLVLEDTLTGEPLMLAWVANPAAS
ncbi:MAG TPA: serpin family protein [Streptosporangiaceae bacterium]|nr:serpin family protein [Streptosporangiaceae bacterium]